MAAQQTEDGAMLDLWDVDSGAPNPAIRSRYATGEALWALALLHETFPEDGFDTVAWPTLDYLSTERDAAENLWPRPWPDQWAAYSLEAMGDWGLADHHLAYARSLAAQFAVTVRWDSQRDGVATVTHPPDPRGAGFGTTLEGSSMLQRLATVEPRLADLAEPLAERVTCGASRLAAAQTLPGPGVPATEAGGWFRDGITRMDDQQHAASAMLWAAVLADLPSTSSTRGRVVNAFLAVVAVLGAWNPPWAGATLAPPTNRRLIGLVIAAAVGVLVAAAGDPILDLLDVSAATFRTAAGAVVAAGGLFHIIRAAARPVEGDTLVAGLAAALGPGPVFAAAAAGIDAGWWVAVPSVAGAAGLTWWLATRTGTDPAVGSWLTRVVGGVAIAAGVLMIVSGVRSV